jgi:hypothetical protein
MDMPIEFLAPQELIGRTGYQRVDDETHEVVGVFFDDGTEAPEPYSYKQAGLIQE